MRVNIIRVPRRFAYCIDALSVMIQSTSPLTSPRRDAVRCAGEHEFTCSLRKDVNAAKFLKNSFHEMQSTRFANR